MEQDTSLHSIKVALFEFSKLLTEDFYTVVIITLKILQVKKVELFLAFQTEIWVHNINHTSKYWFLPIWTQLNSWHMAKIKKLSW